MASSSAQADDAARKAFFEAKIRPVLVNHCYECHAQDAATVEASLFLDNREGVLAGGDTGPAVVPGDLDRSLLLRAVHYLDENLQMPPKNRLSAEEIAVLEKWVAMGAPKSEPMQSDFSRPCSKAKLI